MKEPERSPADISRALEIWGGDPKRKVWVGVDESNRVNAILDAGSSMTKAQAQKDLGSSASVALMTLDNAEAAWGKRVKVSAPS